MTNQHETIAADLAATLSAHRDQPAFVRARIVTRARAAGGAETETWLQGLLACDDDPAVHFRVCEALAHVGTETSLAALDGAARTQNPTVRRIARFAHAVVSHRLRRPSAHLEHVGPRDAMPLAGRATTFDSVPLSPALVGRVVRDLDGHARALAPYLPAGAEVRCGDNRWAVIPHDVGATDLHTAARSGPCVLATVAQLDREHDTWVPARIVLAGPADQDEVYVCVYRRDGVLDLSGVSRRGSAAFSLGAAAHPGAVPIDAVGYWHGVAPVIAGIAGSHGRERRHAQKMA